MGEGVGFLPLPRPADRLLGAAWLFRLGDRLVVEGLMVGVDGEAVGGSPDVVAHGRGRVLFRQSAAQQRSLRFLRGRAIV